MHVWLTGRTRKFEDRFVAVENAPPAAGLVFSSVLGVGTNVGTFDCKLWLADSPQRIRSGSSVAARRFFFYLVHGRQVIEGKRCSLNVSRRVVRVSYCFSIALLPWPTASVSCTEVVCRVLQ